MFIIISLLSGGSKMDQPTIIYVTTVSNDAANRGRTSSGHAARAKSKDSAGKIRWGKVQDSESRTRQQPAAGSPREVWHLGGLESLQECTQGSVEVMPPTVEGVLIDRLTDLGKAGGTNRPWGAVEGEAVGVPLQTTVIQKLTSGRFGL